MTLIIRVRREAEREIEAAFAWYEEQRPGLGGAFLQELDAVFQRISQFPRGHTDVYRGLRRALLRRFPVGVFYLTTETSMQVIAVVHFARDPRVWRTRA